MKSKKILSFVAVMVLLLAFGACKKNRNCFCTTKEGAPDTVVVNVDHGMKCEHILELGIERIQDGLPVVTTQKVDCTELEAENVTTIPSHS